MIIIGVLLLLLNLMFVVIDVKNERIRKGTLMNAAAVGCILTTLLHLVL
jgi:hypothetical protein